MDYAGPGADRTGSASSLRRSVTSVARLPSQRPSSGLAGRHAELGVRTRLGRSGTSAGDAAGLRRTATSAHGRTSQPALWPTLDQPAEDSWVWASDSHHDARARCRSPVSAAAEPSFTIAPAPQARSLGAGALSSAELIAVQAKDRRDTAGALAATRAVARGAALTARERRPAREVEALPDLGMSDGRPWWDDEVDPFLALVLMQVEMAGAKPAQQQPGSGAAGSRPAGAAGRPPEPPPAASAAQSDQPGPRPEPSEAIRCSQPPPAPPRAPAAPARADEWHSWLRGGAEARGAREAAPALALSLAHVNADLIGALAAKLAADMARAAFAARAGAAARAAAGAPAPRLSLAALLGARVQARLQLAASARRYLRDSLLPALDAFANAAPPAGSARARAAAARRRARAASEAALAAARAAAGSRRASLGPPGRPASAPPRALSAAPAEPSLPAGSCELGARMAALRSLLLRAPLAHADGYCLGFLLCLQPLSAAHATAALGSGRVWLRLRSALRALRSLCSRRKAAHLALPKRLLRALRAEARGAARRASSVLCALRPASASPRAGGSGASLGTYAPAGARAAAWDSVRAAWVPLAELAQRPRASVERLRRLLDGDETAAADDDAGDDDDSGSDAEADVADDADTDSEASEGEGAARRDDDDLVVCVDETLSLVLRAYADPDGLLRDSVGAGGEADEERGAAFEDEPGARWLSSAVAADAGGAEAGA